MQRRVEAWLVPVIVALGLIAAVVAGLVTVTRSRNQPLHPTPALVPSFEVAAPSARWQARAGQARQIVRDAVSSQNLPGASVAVAVNGDIVWAEGFGWATLDLRDQVTPATRFRIGHVSKALTSAVVGRLRDQQRLHLDDEVQTHVAAYPRQPWPVTLRQLMGHTAGLQHYANTEWGDKPTRHCERAAEGLTLIPNQSLLFEPGTQYRYSTYGWVLVSAAVEAAAGDPFFAVAQREVFDPLGMQQTVADEPERAMPDRATSYYRGNLGGALTTAVDYSCFAGGGAFLSTPTDLARFGMAMLGDGLLRPATVALLQAPQMLASGASTKYGLGWMLEAVDLAGRSTPVIGHASRTLEGASTSFLTFPDYGLVVAASTNMSFADMRSVALAIAAAFVAQTS